MIKKRIVILANSIKHDPARCIAGVEIVGETDEEILFGDWIRPVSRRGEGELYPAHTVLRGGGQPGVLDVVEIKCERRCSDLTQPENWFISERAEWIRLETLEQSILTDLLEAPENLWLEPGMRSDRVTPEYPARILPQQSLYLIHLREALLSSSGHKFLNTYQLVGRNSVAYCAVRRLPLIRRITLRSAPLMRPTVCDSRVGSKLIGGKP